MATRGLIWLAAAGIILALSPQPGAGLEIGRVKVNSKRGEPLNAMVRIFLAPGEELDGSCLSLANREDFSDPENARLSDAKITLLGKHGPIRITTAAPVTESAVSLALRVQCNTDRISVRPINLYLQGHYSITSTRINPDLPGTTITVRPGDSVYKLSRLIYPHNETAVANLAKAIVMKNPQLFPDGRARPLRVGERLTIPDLRTVERIVSRSAALVTFAAEQPASTPSPAPKRKVQPEQPAAASTAPAVTPQPAPAAKTTHKVIATGRLRLQLATSLELGRTRGMTKQQRAPLRGQAEVAVIPDPHASVLVAQIAGLSTRADRIRQSQDGINARLARLEAAASSLKNAFVQTQAQRPPAPPPARRPAQTRTQPSQRPAAPTTKSTTEPASVPVKPAIAPRVSSTGEEPFFTPAWRSYGVTAALLLVLVIALVLVARKLVTRFALSKQRTRIDAMLKQARTAATPLLGSEPAFETVSTAAQTRTAPPAAEPDTFEAVERMAREESEPEIFDPTKTQPLMQSPSATRPPSAAGGMTSAPNEPPAHLRVEMDDAMDATRSMFSDVDRFITLGRIQNAISLLEFQIKRDPTDRDSWIKLMAVYRGEGMDDDFERIYAGFRDQFGENLAS